MTRLQSPNDWIERLGEEVEERAKHLATMRERAPHTFDHLRSTVRVDVTRLNNELYAMDALKLESKSANPFSFTVTHTELDYMVEAVLDIETATLTYTFYPFHQSEQFQCFIDGLGGLSFSEGSKAIELDEISRRILEPIVRAQFKLDLSK